jgi:hypothetical protein
MVLEMTLMREPRKKPAWMAPTPNLEILLDSVPVAVKAALGLG